MYFDKNTLFYLFIFIAQSTSSPFLGQAYVGLNPSYLAHSPSRPESVFALVYLFTLSTGHSFTQRQYNNQLGP